MLRSSNVRKCTQGVTLGYQSTRHRVISSPVNSSHTHTSHYTVNSSQAST